MKWKKARLDALADLCLGKMLDQNKNKGDLLPYLANVNVRWGDFDLSDLRQMRFESHEMDRYGLRAGDIVMCEGGEPGRCALWKEQMPGLMIQKALHRIRTRETVDSRFLYYSFLHKGRIGAFGHLFTGATIKHLPGQNLAKLEIEFPPLSAQRATADILSAYAFAGEHFSDAPTTRVLTTPGNFRVGGGIKIDRPKFYSDEGPLDSEYVLAPMDLIVTMTDLSVMSDTLGYPALVPRLDGVAFLHNQRVGKVIPTSPWFPRYFLFHAMCDRNYRQHVLGSATGTAVKHTAPKRILSHSIGIHPSCREHPPRRATRRFA